MFNPCLVGGPGWCEIPKNLKKISLDSAKFTDKNGWRILTPFSVEILQNWFLTPSFEGGISIAGKTWCTKLICDTCNKLQEIKNKLFQKRGNINVWLVLFDKEIRSEIYEDGRKQSKPNSTMKTFGHLHKSKIDFHSKFRSF